MGSNGAMVTNQWVGSYYLGSDGAWQPNNKYQDKHASIGKAGTNGASSQSMSEQNGYQDNTQSSSSSSLANKFQDKLRSNDGGKAGTNGASAQSMSEANK
ncbi:hypothetical protein B0H39_002481 [Clostridium beijerinckii]|uniref:hypothetical protein n=1 Tax=Clostridium beijerinckii TaxID=1520 RepID=UPI001494700B|nr:hypothetical protein [Clostridium beijerinckii]NOW84600.1 hypothetical protein [Clostridium beijerinckii]